MRGARIAIVAARFNEFLVAQLLRGANDVLRGSGLDPDSRPVTWVPGAFEIPLAALQLAESGRFDAVICLGAVVRGDTPHFEYVSAAAANGVLRAGMDSRVPCIFGVLTTDNVEQAQARCEGANNKGAEAAHAALDMVAVMRGMRA